MRTFFPLLLITLLFSVPGLGSPSAKSASVNKSLKFSFCYENKTLLPHFAGEGRLVPQTMPGAAIEVLQRLDEKAEGISFHFVRFPWKRCLNDLKQGDIDGVIGRYSEERASFAVYPRLPNGDLDFSKSMINTETCFIYNREFPLGWDGKNLSYAGKLTISVPSGYELINDLKRKGTNVYEAETINLAHRLLFTGRVDASVSNCRLKMLPNGFVQNPIPIVSNPGFLLFSQHFYYQYPKHAETLWNLLREIDKETLYEKYPHNAKEP